jgi:UDP-N-acetylglucosamine acyltransferase
MSGRTLVAGSMPDTARIHPTAIIAADAQLHPSVRVGPYSVIGPQVQVGANSTIAAHVVIEGITRIGADNTIYQFASIGAAPQDKKYAGESTALQIGDRNTIREFATLNRGTVQDQGVTRIGNDNWIMAYVHVAHDCIVGNNTIFANNATLGGHVQVDDWAFLGGCTAIHQFCKVGAHAMTGAGTLLLHDLPPFVMASGNTAQAHGLNSEGMRRRGFSAEQINLLRRAYKALYKNGLTLEQAKVELDQLAAANPDEAQALHTLIGFFPRVSRGIVR